MDEWKMIENAKACKTEEELLSLAKDNGIEMTEEQAKEYFAKLNPANGELSDEELDNVSGGCGRHTEIILCPKCGYISSADMYADKCTCVHCSYTGTKNEFRGAPEYLNKKV